MAYDYDLIIVGGGLAGSTLGKSLAEKGIQVLVLEREKAFRDRVRGEYVHPWGVTEAKALNIHNLLMETCGHESRFRLSQIIGTPPTAPRDMVVTTPHRTGSLHFYHPEMQEVLLQAAEKAGANVLRASTVTHISPGQTPSIQMRTNEGDKTCTARLVVCADGRNSSSRKWAPFLVQHDADRMVLAGALFEGIQAPDTTVYTYINPLQGECALLIPIGGTRFRCYAGYYQQAGRHRLSGEKAQNDFIAACISAGAPPEWFAGGTLVGPLASFDCADTWVGHPFRDGVALVGDAAAASDPCFGCGLSLALRDIRVLGDLLLAIPDWNEAANLYAMEHDRYYGSIHRQTDWMTRLMYEPGPEAAMRRERAFARITEDPRRSPDLAGLGPEFPSDDAAYWDLFGYEGMVTGSAP